MPRQDDEIHPFKARKCWRKKYTCPKSGKQRSIYLGKYNMGRNGKPLKGNDPLYLSAKSKWLDFKRENLEMSEMEMLFMQLDLDIEDEAEEKQSTLEHQLNLMTPNERKQYEEYRQKYFEEKQLEGIDALLFVARKMNKEVSPENRRMIPSEEVSPLNKTIGAFAEEWQGKRERLSDADQRSEGRSRNTKSLITYFVDWAGAERPATDFNNQMVEDYVEHLLQIIAYGRKEKKKVGKRPRGTSDSTQRDRRQVMGQFARWLAAKEVISYPMMLDVDDTKIEILDKKPALMYSPKQFRRLFYISSFTPSHLHVYFLLMANCGMTQQDVSDLKVSEVDWKEGYIKRKRSKTKKKESVPIVEYKLWDLTLKLMKKYGRTKAVEGHMGDRVFTTRAGGELVNAASDRVWQNWDRTVKPKLLGRMPELFDHTPKHIRKTSNTAIEIEEDIEHLAFLFGGWAPQTQREKFYSADHRKKRHKLDKVVEYLYGFYGISRLERILAG